MLKRPACQKQIEEITLAMSSSTIRDWLEDVELARNNGLLQKPHDDTMTGRKRGRGKSPQERSLTAPRRSKRIARLTSSSENNRPQQSLDSGRTVRMRAASSTVFEQLASAGICQAPSLKVDTLPDDAHDLFLAVRGIANAATPIIPAAIFVRVSRTSLQYLVELGQKLMYSDLFSGPHTNSMFSCTRLSTS